MIIWYTRALWSQEGCRMVKTHFRSNSRWWTAPKLEMVKLLELRCVCFYHLRWLRQLKRHVNRNMVKQLVLSWLLQFCYGWSAMVNHCSTATCTKCSCSTGYGTVGMWSHRTRTTRTAPAASCSLHKVQSSTTDVCGWEPSLPSVHQRSTKSDTRQ